MSTLQEVLEPEFISIWHVTKQQMATLNPELPKWLQCGSPSGPGWSLDLHPKSLMAPNPKSREIPRLDKVWSISVQCQVSSRN